MSTLLPWERQPYDTEESWGVFVAYRDQANPRRALSIFVRGQRAVSPIQISQWMEAHYWRARVAEYDRHVDALRREQRECLLAQQTRDVTADQMSILADARDVAAREFEKLRALATESPGETMKARDLIRLVETVVKLERLVRGESTENVQEQGPDLSNLSEDDLAKLESIIDKTEGDNALVTRH